MAVKKNGKEYESYVDYEGKKSSGADKTFLTQDQQSQVSQYKADWEAAKAAGDQAGMDAAHAAAEAIREQAGYSGGANGGAYNKLVQPGGSTGSTGGGRGGGSSGSSGSSGGAAQTPFTYAPFTYKDAPSYVSRYQSQIDELTKQILGREAFSYDPEKDESYLQYKDSYTRAGQRAMQDTLGQVAARTGGLASSYAGSAAQQTYDGYMSALADKVPELRQLAYSMYMDEGDALRGNLQMLTGLEQGDYAKYQTALGQYNADRELAYRQYGDSRGLDYQLWRDGVSDGRYQTERDYQVGRDQVSDRRYQDETAYGRAQDAWQRQRYESEDAYSKALAKAQTLAAAGDFSGYREMGYTEEEVAALKAGYDRDQAAAALKTGSSGTGGSSGGKGTSSSGGGEDRGDIYQRLYDGGARTYSDAYAALLAMGYKSTDADRLAKGLVEKVEAGTFEKEVSGADAFGAGGPQVDMSSVQSLGYGPISAGRLDELVRSGAVEEYEEDGYIRFRRRPKPGGIPGTIGKKIF